MSNGLTTFRLDYLLPPLGHDPGVEAHAQDLLWKRWDFCNRMVDFIHPNTDNVPPSGSYRASRLWNFAWSKARVTLLFVRHTDWAHRQFWEVRPQTLADAFGGDFSIALYVRNAQAVERFEAFVARHLGDIRDLAVARTAASILALVLAFARLTSRLAEPIAGFGRQVDALIQRVLAAGGQTAGFAPLT